MEKRILVLFISLFLGIQFLSADWNSFGLKTDKTTVLRGNTITATLGYDYGWFNKEDDENTYAIVFDKDVFEFDYRLADEVTKKWGMYDDFNKIKYSTDMNFEGTFDVDKDMSIYEFTIYSNYKNSEYDEDGYLYECSGMDQKKLKQSYCDKEKLNNCEKISIPSDILCDDYNEIIEYDSKIDYDVIKDLKFKVKDDAKPGLYFISIYRYDYDEENIYDDDKDHYFEEATIPVTVIDKESNNDLEITDVYIYSYYAEDLVRYYPIKNEIKMFMSDEDDYISIEGVAASCNKECSIDGMGFGLLFSYEENTINLTADDKVTYKLKMSYTSSEDEAKKYREKVVVTKEEQTTNEEPTTKEEPTRKETKKEIKEEVSTQENNTILDFINNNSKTIIISIFSLAFVLLIVLIIVIIRKKKKTNNNVDTNIEK